MSDPVPILHVLWSVVLPVFLVAGLGVILQRSVGFEISGLSRPVFYIFSPSLAFVGLYSLDLQAIHPGRAVVFALLVALVMGMLGLGLSRLHRYNRSMTSASVLTLINNNTGNYGLPLNQFAFGMPGLQLATLYFVINSTLANSVGVYIASSGRAHPTEALRNVLKTPLVYATVLALIANAAHLSVPEPVYKAIALSGQAAVPTMLVILGYHLGRLGTHIRWRRALPITLVKLLVGPAVAWGISSFLGLEGLMRAVAIVQSSVPTAVMSTVLATEFDCEPEYVAEVVFTTTVFSLLTLTTVLTLVKTWVLG